MRKKEILMTLALLILITFSIYLIFYEQKVNHYFINKDLESFKKLTIDCVVKYKYVNEKNHLAKTVIFNNCENLIVIKDSSRFFDFIEPKDSVVKALNTDTLRVYREGRRYNFRVSIAIKD